MLLHSNEMKGKGSAGCKCGSSHFAFSVPYSTNSVGGYEGVTSQLSMCKILLLLKKSSPPFCAHTFMMLPFLYQLFQ